jgi:homoserine kinase
MLYTRQTLVKGLNMSNILLWGIESGIVDQARIALQDKMHATCRRQKLASASHPTELVK